MVSPDGGRGESEGGERRVVVYCIVPRDLAARLHEPLRRFFRDDPTIEVIVERRGVERRRAERREETGAAPEAERRRIPGRLGRRVAERRATLASVGAPELPRRARPFADRIVFAERLEPSAERLEDVDTAHLVTAIQAGEGERFTELYLRYFNRVYAYLRALVRDAHEAEDLAQQAFVKVMQALPDYERRSQPFRAWLFTIVRNEALRHLERQGRLTVEDPDEVSARREANGESEPPQPLAAGSVFDWITDRDLTLFVERLPDAQRQVLVLRYLLGLSHEETAKVLERTPGDVRKLQSRALAYLRQRLAAARSRGDGRIRRDRAVLRARKQAPVLRMRRFSLVRW